VNLLELFKPTTPGGWAVLGGVIVALAALLGKLLDFKLFKEKDSARLRKELWSEIGELRGEVKALRTRVEALEFELAMEKVVGERQRELKHHYRNRLGEASMVLHLYRGKHGRLEEDEFEWCPEDAEPDTQSSPLLKRMVELLISSKSGEGGVQAIIVPRT
jgi:predicted nuclease with TOPRIM domain